VKRYPDDGSSPLEGVGLRQINHHGRWGWMIDTPLRGRAGRGIVDEFDTLSKAVAEFEAAAEKFNNAVRDQRAADQRVTDV
jgi:hypothetical protein